VVKEFKKRGYWVRPLTRSEDRLKNLSDYVDEAFVDAVTDPASLAWFCEGIDIVFSSIGITKQKDNMTYMDVDYQGNKNLLEEAKMAISFHDYGDPFWDIMNFEKWIKQEADLNNITTITLATDSGE